MPPFARIAILLACLSTPCAPAAAPALLFDWPSAVTAAARLSPTARILVLDIPTNRLLASHHLPEAARTLAAPGSTLKPLVLYQLLADHRWSPDQRITCPGQLVIAGHRLACSHPPAPAFDARQALAWSCNTYFAQLARSLRPGELDALLRPTGLVSPTGLVAQESSADFHPPQSPDEIQLALLGIDGLRITPLELAEAYRWLALELAAHPASVAAQTVLAGLTDSASFGMAGQAALGDIPVAGKTGTAPSSATARTHGWFAGLVPATHPQTVLLVFVPAGRGADAAHLAGTLLAHVQFARAPQEHP